MSLRLSGNKDVLSYLLMLRILCCMQVYLTIQANSTLEIERYIFSSGEVLKYQNADVAKITILKKNIITLNVNINN